MRKISFLLFFMFGAAAQGAVSTTSSPLTYFFSNSFVVNPASGNVTACVWFKETQMGTSPSFLVSQADSGGTGRGWIRVTTSPFVLSSLFQNIDLSGTTALSLNTWYHACVEVQGTTVKLFLNGNQEGSASRTIETSNGILLFGTTKAKVAINTLTGSIDDVRVYNRALSNSEIQNLYSSRQKAFLTDGNVLWYPLDEGLSGAKAFTEIDRSSSRNSGSTDAATQPTSIGSIILNYP